MTVCGMITTLVIGIVSGVIATYVVRFFDNRRKNDRHMPESDH